MGVVAPGGGREFELCPKGWTQAVCVDVVELGLIPSQWGEKYKVQLRFQTAKRDSEGRRFLLFSRQTQSMNPRANLYKLVSGWLGRDIPPDEREFFDLEEHLLGKNCMIHVVHSEPDAQGVVWANIQSITPVQDEMRAIEPEDYTRVIDQDDYVPPEKTYQPPQEYYEKRGIEPPDDIPF